MQKDTWKLSYQVSKNQEPEAQENTLPLKK